MLPATLQAEKSSQSITIVSLSLIDLNFFRKQIMLRWERLQLPGWTIIERNGLSFSTQRDKSAQLSSARTQLNESIKSEAARLMKSFL
ncbi:MAG: hypothetical protein K2M80_05975, partial [Muribaculaceae bacterium]|nr:hypothetical protein [Muribaculaceae bacterium]